MVEALTLVTSQTMVSVDERIDGLSAERLRATSIRGECSGSPVYVSGLR